MQLILCLRLRGKIRVKDKQRRIVVNSPLQNKHLCFQAHPNHISISAVLVDYDTPTGRHMKGVATAWLKLKQASEKIFTK